MADVGRIPGMGGKEYHGRGYPYDWADVNDGGVEIQDPGAKSVGAQEVGGSVGDASGEKPFTVPARGAKAVGDGAITAANRPEGE